MAIDLDLYRPTRCAPLGDMPPLGSRQRHWLTDLDAHPLPHAAAALRAYPQRIPALYGTGVQERRAREVAP